MKRLKILTSAFFIALALIASPGSAHASEGTAEIKSTTGDKTRCFASSVLMQNFEYKVIVSCRDLIYPPTEDSFAYVIWAVSLEDSKVLRLGSLGFGKVELRTKDAFSELFVTTERNDRPRNPSVNIVARGFMSSIDILEKGTPEDTTEATEPAESFAEILEQPTPTPTITTVTGGITSGLRRTGIYFAVGVFILLLFIAFLTRSRG